MIHVIYEAINLEDNCSHFKDVLVPYKKKLKTKFFCVHSRLFFPKNNEWNKNKLTFSDDWSSTSSCSFVFGLTLWLKIIFLGAT